MTDTAIILCGGRGSRMGDSNRPKALIPVHGRPIIWYIIRRLHMAGFRHFVLPAGFLGQDIRDHVETEYGDLNCDIHCLDTGEDTPIAGRIEQVRHLLPDGSAFFLTNGDALFDFDIEGMVANHSESKSSATFAVVETLSKFGLLVVDDGEVVDFERDSHVSHYTVRRGERVMDGHVYSGMAILNETALNMVDLKTCENFEKALYPKLIGETETDVFTLDGFWHAIDTPKDLQAAESLFSSPIKALTKKLGATIC